jgi:hypothetical protein
VTAACIHAGNLRDWVDWVGVGLPMPWGWEESLKRRQPALGRNQRNGLWDQAGRQRRGRRPQACTAHVNAPPALMPENRRSVCTGTGVAEVVSPSAPSCPSLFNLHGSRREGDGGFECSSAGGLEAWWPQGRGEGGGWLQQGVAVKRLQRRPTGTHASSGEHMGIATAARSGSRPACSR